VTMERAAGTVDDKPKIGRIVLALAVALTLVAGAWIVGDQQGFSSIGGGGTNARLLPRVGEVAPDLQAYRLNERLQPELVSLSDFRGQPVWLNFWASWCQPCRAEMPDLKAAYQELDGTGIVMLAISLDEPIEDAYLYAAQNQVTFVILSDPTREHVAESYQINNFPTHIFIDAEGIVRSVQLAPLSTQQALASANAAIHPVSS
jgi:cytochrome c biogenesis protein CcmG, thiol:disulfide interchange protein DsbE